MRVKVDFDVVPEDQRAMDKRLANWAVWCNGSSGTNVSPMFRLYRSPPTRGDCNAGGPGVDAIDARRIAAAVALLPLKVRLALCWHYIKPQSPARACRQLNTSMEGLAAYVVEGRRRLIEQSV